MEFGLVRPVITGVTVPTPRPPETGRSAIPTELAGPAVVTEVNATEPAVTDYRNPVSGVPPTQFAAERSGAFAVTESDDGSGDPNGDGTAASAQREVEEHVERDEKTKDFVYRQVDVDTGDVVKQVPEEVLMKIRATMRAFGEIAAPGRSPVYDLTA